MTAAAGTTSSPVHTSRTPATRGARIGHLVSADRDPRRYGDPDRLDITGRPPDGAEGPIGFGHGIHYCVGATLSRLQCEIALTTLVTGHPGMRLADGPESLRRTVIPWAPPRLPHLRVRV
ncbi:hypothetical protein ACIRU3_36610 [Streptomyces sp. NPDC101151]|uniref:hypothetical protein n=1 Tax=Streptomyces sp. NPDC101151 TaxID=3366115 RepID=UPI0037FAC079